MATNGRIVTVFGGAGFLVRRKSAICRSRISSPIAPRHPIGARHLGLDDPQLRSVYADIHDERSGRGCACRRFPPLKHGRLYVEPDRIRFIPYM